jgi:hypothetical protein
MSSLGAIRFVAEARAEGVRIVVSAGKRFFDCSERKPWRKALRTLRLWVVTREVRG